MTDVYSTDVFLSHGAKDSDVVREIHRRFQSDGLRVWVDAWATDSGDELTPQALEALDRSRVLVLFVSMSVIGEEWARLEWPTFRFRDPLNKSRRFVLVRLDEAPIRGSLAQLPYIDWSRLQREEAYARLLEACLPPPASPLSGVARARDTDVGKAERLDAVWKKWYGKPSHSNQTAMPTGPSAVRLLHKLKGHAGRIFAVALSESGEHVVSADSVGEIRTWDARTGTLVFRREGDEVAVREIALTADLVFAGYEDGTIRVWNTFTGDDPVRTLNGHSEAVYGLAISEDASLLVSGSKDGTMRIWNAATGTCIRVLQHRGAWVNSVAVLPDAQHVIAADEDGSIGLWDIETGKRRDLPAQHNSWVWGVAYSASSRRMVSGSGDATVGVWDMQGLTCRHVFEGHEDKVSKVAISRDGRWALSGSLDKTAIIWDLDALNRVATLSGHEGSVESVAMSADGRLIATGSDDACVGVWEYAPELRGTGNDEADSVTYTNAKVLIVGDTHAGKTAIAHRLATGRWRPSADSTVGAWSSQLRLSGTSPEKRQEREVWLWDFGGQADQRLIHQLFMDRAALVLLLFNADDHDVLPGLRDWQAALHRSVKGNVPRFLVAGRIDAGFRASRSQLQAFSDEEGFKYFETSAKTGEGLEVLHTAILDRIPWDQLESRTSPRIFQLIKTEILKLRDEGEVLHTFKELREVLRRRLGKVAFSDETLQTVVGLLDGPGVVKELNYGTYILLAPEWVNVYAQAVIRTLRNTDHQLGALPLRSISEGHLVYQSVGRDGKLVDVKRLQPAAERILLGEMERQLEQRGLCLRQGDKLVFPSHCGRDRSISPDSQSLFVGYSVKGFLDDIYSTLVVKLADSEAFRMTEVWRDAADFATLAGDHYMGIKLTRQGASTGEIGIYFGTGVTQEEQVIFATYVHSHIAKTAEQTHRVRHYVCPKCGTPKGNSSVLRDKLLEERERADTECDRCGLRFRLGDGLEKAFASVSVLEEVAKLQAVDLAQLTSRRKGKLLMLDVAARITSANQKWLEIPGDEDDGIDMQMEFTGDDGNGVGKGLYLQLKAGNAHLTKRKSDGVEVFRIKKQRWVKTWISQPHPVMLVIGTFANESGSTGHDERIQFSEVRWMEITSVLKELSALGTKTVSQIEFRGERMDLSSIRRWRETCLSRA